MLLYLLQHLSAHWHSLRVFDYLSLRAITSALTALLISLFASPMLIRRLNKLQIGQVVRDDGPKKHLEKTGTPTMGGVLILLSITISVLLWGNLTNAYLWLTLFVMLSFAVIGGIDDYRKVVHKNTRGLPARWKFFWQSVIALVVSFYLYTQANTHAQTALIIPFFKHINPDLGWGFIILSFFTITGSSNAVNLTDGLDGLAVLPTVMIAGALGLFAYISGNIEFSHYLNLPSLPGAGELIIFTSSMIGAGLGFLWFNTYPAMVFMGDVGALSLGATLGIMAVIVRQELVLLLMGGIFVIETLSVIIQVISFKLTGKRVFRMAPLHHHFELKGWPEPRVIVRFWIITFMLVLIGLATIKLR